MAPSPIAFYIVHNMGISGKQCLSTLHNASCNDLFYHFWQFAIWILSESFFQGESKGIYEQGPCYILIMGFDRNIWHVKANQSHICHTNNICVVHRMGIIYHTILCAHFNGLVCDWSM
jgi:hypothetical protein